MTDFTLPDADGLMAARERFTGLAELDRMATEERDPGAVAITLSRLKAYADGDIPFPDEVMEASLAANPNLRAAYRDLIRRTSLAHFPQAIAASTGDIPSRHGQGYVIRTEVSQAQSDQIYIIIELTGAAALGKAPGALFLSDREKRISRFELPGFRDGIAQLISERDAPLARLLADPKTEAFLS